MASKPRRSVGPQIDLTFDCAGPGAQALGEHLRSALKRWLTQLDRPQAEVSLRLVNDRKIQALNAQWRGKNKATDVLSFPLENDESLTNHVLGDIVISTQTARRVSTELGTVFSDEMRLYCVHGLLHLLGYDHETSPKEAARMKRLERRLLGSEGMLSRAETVVSAPRRERK
jgi:probable rRNA maturation factor